MIVKEIFSFKNNIGNKINENEYSLNYDLNDEVLMISYKNKKESEVQEIEEIFSEIKYDLKNEIILNQNEIIQKWKKIYSKLLLDENEDLQELVVELNRYYKNIENIDFIVNNAGLFPFFKIIFSNKTNLLKFKFFGILSLKEFELDIKKERHIDNNIEIVSIKGTVPSTFDFISLKRQLKNTLEISADKLFEMNICLNGKIEYEQGILKRGNIEMKLTTNGYIEKIYTVELDGEN